MEPEVEKTFAKKKIGSAASLLSGFAFRSEDFTTKGIPLIKIANIRDRIVRLDCVDYFPESKLSKKLTDFFLKDKDVLIAMTGQGSVGRVGRIRLESEQRVLMNQRVGKFVVDENKLNMDFLYYVISSPKYEAILFDAGIGSGQPNLSPDVILSIEIPFPEKEVQDKIAKILNSIEDKIAVNNEINSFLSKISEAIFERWFVDFEFPNERGKPYKSFGGQLVFNHDFQSLIPNDWKVVKLCDILSLLKDGTHTPPNRTRSGIKFIAGASDLKHFDIDFSKCTYISEDDYADIHKNWKIEVNDILLTIVGTVGNVAIVKPNDLPFSMQRSIAILRPNEKIGYPYLYFLVNSKLFRRFIASRLNSTAQPGIYLGSLSEFKVSLPTKEIIDSFNKAVECNIVKMQLNNLESSILKEMRDVLLPKLIKGKILGSNVN